MTQRKPIRITPPLPEDCVERDLELCQQLVQSVVDPEKGVPSSTYDRIQEQCNTQELTLT